MAPAFQRIAEDLSHGHLLAFRPAEDPADGWHSTHVSVRGRSRSVRAREGYSPD
ncbi:MAG: hypothetical protein LAQ30_25375 [Acidobacteriia bacterium]|nr:hypothetical protein [Terriglobia bacterium]